jgi:hypothetical protein
MDVYMPAVEVGEIPTVERVMIFVYEVLEERIAVACCHELDSSFRTDRMF